MAPRAPKSAETLSLYVVAFKDGYIPEGESGAQDPIMTGAGDPPSSQTQNVAIEATEMSVAVDQDELQAQDLCDGYGAEFVEVYAGLGGFSARMISAQAQSMASDPGVKTVEEDYEMDLPTSQALSDDPSNGNWQWGLDAIDQTAGPRDYQFNYTATGTGVNVFVVDSGVWSAHPDFGGRVSLDQNIVKTTQPAIDNYGHGTWIASIIGGSTSGVAKGAMIRTVKVTDNLTTATMSNVAKGLSWVFTNYSKYRGPSVVHCSVIAGSTFKDATLVKKAVNKLLDKGVPVVIPAGNYYNTNVSSVVPANQPRAHRWRRGADQSWTDRVPRPAPG